MKAVEVLQQEARGRQARGLGNYLSGLAAEALVAADYAARGYPVLARRWRGLAGELDLVCADGEGIVVVEVKKARSLDAAAGRVTRRQAERIAQTALEFAGRMPLGLRTPIRVDLALVDGMGSSAVIENLFLEG